MSPSRPVLRDAAFLLFIALLPGAGRNVAAASLPAPGLVGAVPALPAPSGPLAIGTLLVDWTDREREETWTDEPGDLRRVVVQFWYPAESKPVRVPAPYVMRYPQLRESLDRYWSGQFPTMTTHAGLESEPQENVAPFPVVLFSHGMNSSRTLYTALAEDLASHGYVVALIDHPYWGPGVAFEDGRTVRFEEGMPGVSFGANRIDERVQNGIATMTEDQAFVARQLPSMLEDRRVRVRQLARRMDLERVAVAGHAMGGIAAVRAAYTYTRFRAAVTLDGYVWKASDLSGMGGPAAPSAKPLLVLLSDGGVRGDSLAFARRHLDAFRSPQVVRVEDTRPGSVTDIGFLSPGAHSAEDVAAHRRICDTMRAFSISTCGPAAGSRAV